MLNESPDIIFKALEDNSCVNFSSCSFFAFLQQKGEQGEQWVPKLQKNDWFVNLWSMHCQQWQNYL